MDFGCGHPAIAGVPRYAAPRRPRIPLGPVAAVSMSWARWLRGIHRAHPPRWQARQSHRPGRSLPAPSVGPRPPRPPCGPGTAVRYCLQVLPVRPQPATSDGATSQHSQGSAGLHVRTHSFTIMHISTMHPPPGCTVHVVYAPPLHAHGLTYTYMHAHHVTHAAHLFTNAPASTHLPSSQRGSMSIQSTYIV